MSAWLVDTHALLWFLEDSPKLSSTAKATLEAGDSVLLVSAASVWEIAIKARLGKLTIPDDFPELVRAQGIDELAVTAVHSWATRSLPASEHKDPFDRLLAAQAKLEQLPIISGDAALDQYGIDRHW